MKYPVKTKRIGKIWNVFKSLPGHGPASVMVVCTVINKLQESLHVGKLMTIDLDDLSCLFKS